MLISERMLILGVVHGRRNKNYLYYYKQFFNDMNNVRFLFTKYNSNDSSKT